MVSVAKHLTSICLWIPLLPISPSMCQLFYPRKDNLTLSLFLLHSSESSQTFPYHLVVVGFLGCFWTLKRSNLSGPSVDGPWPCGCYIYIMDHDIVVGPWPCGCYIYLVVYLLFTFLADSYCLTPQISSGPLGEDVLLPSSLGAIILFPGKLLQHLPL